MAKKLSKHTKLMYALIAAIVALLAFGGARLKEGFQTADKIYQIVGFRMESSDANIKKAFIIHTNKSIFPNTKVTNISTGEVLLTTSDTKETITSQINSTSDSSAAIGTINTSVYAIDINKLTDSTDIKMYEINMPPMGPNLTAAEFEENKKNFDSSQVDKETKNLIVKNTSTGEIQYYPPLTPSKDISAQEKNYFERLKNWDLSDMEKGFTIAGAVVLGLIFLRILFKIIF